MRPEFAGCKNCGGPLKIVPSQYLVRCNHCRSEFYHNQQFPPAVVLEQEVDLKTAKANILKALRHKQVAKKFLKSSFFEKGRLFYIPFFEVRGIKAGWSPPDTDNRSEYNYQSFDYLERANDLNNLDLGFFDYSIVEESLLKARQMPFDPVVMRKKGEILPPDEIVTVLKKAGDESSVSVVEKYYRLIYFPVWEIGYTHKGIIFRSYLSAVDGKVIKLHALRDHKLKLFLAIGGLFSLGTLITRVFKMAWIMMQTPAIGFSLFFFVLGFPVLLLLTALLLPYLWRLFAFREEVKIMGALIEYQPINYTENSWIRMSRKVGEKLSQIFGGADEELPFSEVR